MADLSMVDIEVVLYSLSGSKRLKRTAGTRGGNYSGPCPKCGGNDRFYILPEAEDGSGNRRGKWACRNCHTKEGDAVELLVYMEGMTEAQAFARLKELYPELPTSHKTQPTKQETRVRLASNTAVPPCAQWQERACLAWEAAIKRLWSEAGREARDYLLQRGLTEETMRMAQLGYIARDTWDADPEAWGLNTRDVEGVYIPAGLLFPYTYKGEVWKLQIRRIGPDVPKDKRYPVVAGSAQGLFQADTLKVNHPALLFEGPINALSAAQEIGDLAACVATGGASLARIDQWKTRLVLASQVLLCFDGDEAGKEAIEYWRKRLGESASYLPAVGDGCKDANDMLAAGVSLVSWVAPYFFTPIVGPMGPMGLTSSLVEDIPQSFYDRPCWRCGRIGEAQRRMEDGLWLCPCYFPVVQMAMGMREQVSV